MTTAKHTILFATAVALLGAASGAHALESCKVKLDPKTGAIQFSAKDVFGVLRWGESLASANRVFANDPACTAKHKATRCELGTPGSASQITPPELCKIFVRDIGGGPSCSAYIKGCTPGVRPGGTAAAAPGAAKAGVVAFCSATANDVQIRRSFNNVNASAITIDDGVLPGRCEITFPFSLADKYYSVEVVSLVSSTTTFKIDYEIDGNTIKILTQQYLVPAWAGFGLDVSVLIF